ncbi:serine/threonine protein kinase [Deinococcus aerophilus]|uniref:Serine/threonine protein kinase n=1 Tax=Deinococcus aerophilus TaxID=522488 RepID=A0ABQ2GWE8_9DEIO|nr:serine/threonine protein kinase [Deinococcus aerophilus]GGM14104.1 serine/threonine protein kinase [Deinococcus aerophilus]
MPAPTTIPALLTTLGTVFQVFDERTQDSGNVSYGLQTPGGERLFVKTAGRSQPSPGSTPYAERVATLRRTAVLQQELAHPALIPVLRVFEGADGIAVIQPWFGGELLRAPAQRRNHPAEAHARFRQRPLPEILHALDSVIDLHTELARQNWVAGDFYDGCLMYDFRARQIRFMDLECYRRGPYRNTVGRLPGSTRFMAPEEFRLGAVIDHRTTVFNLGRLLAVFTDWHPHPPRLAQLIGSATHPDPESHPDSPVAFQAMWRDAVREVPEEQG